MTRFWCAASPGLQAGEDVKPPPAAPLHRRINDYLRQVVHVLPLPAVLLLDEAATALSEIAHASTPMIDHPGLWRVDRYNDRWTATRLSDAWNPDLDFDDGK